MDDGWMHYGCFLSRKALSSAVMSETERPVFI